MSKISRSSCRRRGIRNELVVLLDTEVPVELLQLQVLVEIVLDTLQVAKLSAQKE